MTSISLVAQKIDINVTNISESENIISDCTLIITVKEKKAMDFYEKQEINGV